MSSVRTCVATGFPLFRGMGVGKDIGPPREEQVLDVLERVRLDAGAHPLPDDLKQVDEDFAAEELVDFFFPRGMRAHQAGKRPLIAVDRSNEVLEDLVHDLHPLFRIELLRYGG